MARLSLTWGRMPTRDQFDDAFDAVVGAGGTYEIKNDNGGRSGNYDSRDLWNLLNEEMKRYEQSGEEDDNGDLVDPSAEEHGDFVSAALSTLGIEWI